MTAPSKWAWGPAVRLLGLGLWAMVVAGCASLSRQDVDFLVQGGLESVRGQWPLRTERTTLVLVDVLDPEGLLGSDQRDWFWLELEATALSPRLAPTLRLLPRSELVAVLGGMGTLDPDPWSRLEDPSVRSAVRRHFEAMGAPPDYFLRGTVRRGRGVDRVCWVLRLEARSAVDWVAAEGIGRAGR